MASDSDRPPKPARQYSVFEMIAAATALAASVGGYVVYDRAESRAVAQQAVAQHAAHPAHTDAVREHAEMRAELKHNLERIGRLEAQGLVMSEILLRIEDKVDAIGQGKRRR